MPPKTSAVRRALIWWFDAPANAHVSASIAVDFSHARRWLEQLSAQGQRVSIHHLVVATVARVLHEFPQANARIFGGKIVRKKEVGVVMPVNLLGHAGESRSELSVSIVKGVDRMSLQQLAADSRKDTESIRKGEANDPFARFMFRFTEVAPEPLFRAGLRLLDFFGRSRLGDRFFELTPFTTAVSNPGAALGAAPGVWFRGGAVSLPQRLLHVGTLWGVGLLQDEVVPVEGRAEVRPILPILLVFDHRLVDGVMASRMMMRFGEILRDPARVFGEQGEKVPE